MKQNKKTELKANFATKKADAEAMLSDDGQSPALNNVKNPEISPTAGGQEVCRLQDSEINQSEDSADKNMIINENTFFDEQTLIYPDNELIPIVETEDELVKVSRPDRRKKIFGILLMLGSSVCVCLGQMFWRLYAQKYLGYLVLGCVFFIISAVFTILAYRFGKLSELQPILSLNYPLSMIIAYIMFGEKITLIKIIAIIIISAGVMLIAGGKTNEHKPR